MICESALQFLLSLVNDTLDYAQMQEGKFSINFGKVQLEDLTQQVFKLINVQMQAKHNVSLVLSEHSELPCEIETDFQRIK
jgi:signal transduction histidine kinase